MLEEDDNGNTGFIATSYPYFNFEETDDPEYSKLVERYSYNTDGYEKINVVPYNNNKVYFLQILKYKVKRILVDIYYNVSRFFYVSWKGTIRFLTFKWLYYFIERGLKGYSQYDLVDFNYYLAKMLSRALKDFRKKSYSIPARLTEKKWDKILNDMQNGFVKYLDMDYIEASNDVRDYVREYGKKRKIVDKGLKLFAEHFYDLFY